MLFNMSLNKMKWLYQKNNNIKIKKYARAPVTTKQFSQCPQAVDACTWIIVLESIDHKIHLHWKFLRKEKTCDFVNVSVVIKSFFLYYGHNVSYLIFALCYVCDTYCLRHFLWFFCTAKFVKLIWHENFM